MEKSFQLGVAGELGTLKRVLVHRPDAGIGLIPTHKTEEWLYDDIVDVPTMQREFDVFRELLDLVVGTSEADDVREHPVMDSQRLLESLINENHDDARELIVSLCTLEGVNFPRKDDLLAMLAHGKEDPSLIKALVQTLLSGQLAYASLEGEKPHRLPAGSERYIFAPIPNFIFTRDIGVTMGDHILITQPKYNVRRREVWLFRFIAEHFLVRNRRPLRFSVGEDDHNFLQDEEQSKLKAVSYEGGDIMMISPRHVLIGWSERTTPHAIEKLVKQIFWLPIQTGSPTGIDTVSVVKIGARRSQMHIDTVFTHVRNDVWALHALLAEGWQSRQVESRIEPVEVFQYYLHDLGRAMKQSYAEAETPEQKETWAEKFQRMDFRLKTDTQGNYENSGCLYTRQPKGLQDLLTLISVNEFGVEKASQVQFVLSGKGQYPYSSREQWTDACNLVALRPGIVVGYDRNPVTIAHFNEVMQGEPGIENEDLRTYIVQANSSRFANLAGPSGELPDMDHVVHTQDLFAYLALNNLKGEDAKTLIDQLNNVLFLIPSSELSRARGGSHCMTLPLLRS